MGKDNLVYIKDMLLAVNQILEYSDGCDYVRFANTKMIQDAVIRNLEILGEAAKKLADEFAQNNPNLPVKKIRGMSNLLIHRYDYVDVDEVWKVIETDLMPLQAELKKILKKL